MLLMATDPIFEELESHQVSLQAMQSNSAAGSFLDEVVKWQKRLQTIEAVLSTWLEVQEKWVELEEVCQSFCSVQIKKKIHKILSVFSVFYCPYVSHDFKLAVKWETNSYYFLSVKLWVHPHAFQPFLQGETIFCDFLFASLDPFKNKV